MIEDASFWIKKLDLTPHPEGGYYKETYQSQDIVKEKALPFRFQDDRSFSTAIYYLLDRCVSKFHRLKSDEIWHYYYGGSLTIYIINSKGELEENRLGLNLDQKESPQIMVPHGSWFGAKLNNPSGFALVGCTVSPGFHFNDFVLADHTLSEQFPQYAEIIKELT